MFHFGGQYDGLIQEGAMFGPELELLLAKKKISETETRLSFLSHCQLP